MRDKASFQRTEELYADVKRHATMMIENQIHCGKPQHDS